MSINDEIKMLNEKAKVLNNQRMQALGAKQVAEANYKKALEDYASKYGVVLTDANFENEYNTNVAKLNDSVEKLRQQIEDIESGKYKEKVQLTSVENTVEDNAVAEVKNVVEEKATEEVVAQPKRRGRPPKNTVVQPTNTEKTEEEFPFDGGVVIGEKAVEPVNQPNVGVQIGVTPTVTPNQNVEIKIGGIESPTAPTQPTIQPTVQPTVQPTIQPMIQPMVQPMQPSQLVVQPSITPIQIGIPAQQNVGIKIGETQPNNTTEQPIQIKPMDVPIVVDDEDDTDDEDIPDLTWSKSNIDSTSNTTGVSLNDFHGFKL